MVGTQSPGTRLIGSARVRGKRKTPPRSLSMVNAYHFVIYRPVIIREVVQCHSTWTNYIFQSRSSARSVQLLAWISLQQKQIHFTRLSSSNQQQGEQLSSRKQHAISCQLTTHCARIQTRHPVFQLSDEWPNKIGRTADTGTKQQHAQQYVFHASCTAPKSIGEKADLPMRHRDERMQQLVPSVDAVHYDLPLAQLKIQTCYFALVCIHIISYELKQVISCISHKMYKSELGGWGTYVSGPGTYVQDSLEPSTTHATKGVKS